MNLITETPPIVPALTALAVINRMHNVIKNLKAIVKD